jgi:mono/diheme cytochrome c family protein
MRRRVLFALAAALIAASPAAAETFTPSDERQEDYPDAPGREQTFYACIACHGFKLVAQQGQTRQQWDDTLNWMTEKHRMPPIDGDLRKTVLDYLAAAFPPRASPGGWKNPFSGQ